MTNEDHNERLERCLRQAEERPDSAVAQFNLGLAYTSKGRIDRAEPAYREALRLDADMVEAWVNLGGVLMLKWDYQGSIEANREALKRKADVVLAHYNIGQASLYLGHGEDVVQANRQVLELEPNHAAGHYFLAVGLLATGRKEQAREAVARAKALGHSPTPEFLRALEKADGNTQANNQSSATHIGAEAPNNPNRR